MKELNKKFFLDLTNDKCPITFIKTKIALEKLKLHEKLTVRINEGDDLNLMPQSLEEIGFKIINKKTLKENVAEVVITQI